MITLRSRPVVPAFVLPVLSLWLAACAGEATPRVVDDAALAATDQGGDWLAFGHRYDERRSAR